MASNRGGRRMVDTQKNECPAYHRGKHRSSKLVETRTRVYLTIRDDSRSINEVLRLQHVSSVLSARSGPPPPRHCFSLLTHCLAALRWRRGRSKRVENASQRRPHLR